MVGLGVGALLGPGLGCGSSSASSWFGKVALPGPGLGCSGSSCCSNVGNGGSGGSGSRNCNCTPGGQASQPMHAALGAVPGVGASEEVVKFQRKCAFGAFP